MPDNIQSRVRSPRRTTRGGDTDSTLYIATDSDGNPNAFNVERNDNGLWLYAHYVHPDNVWNPDNRWLFVSRNLLHFSPSRDDFLVAWFAGEFCFVSWPFQPPSILPISFKGTDRTTYFLLSRDLVSHKANIKTMRVFNFLIASLTHGCFSSLFKKPAIETDSIISTNSSSIFWPNEWRWVFGRIW